MVIIKQIAKEAGVSASTVSRVINRKPYVSNEIRNRIQMIIDKYGYVPNSKAVSLSLGRSGNIGVIIPYSSNIQYYNTISNGIIREAFRHDLRVTFLPTDYDIGKEIEYLKFLKGKEFDGLIIVSATNSFQNIAVYACKEPIVCCEDVGNFNIGAVYIEREKALLDIIKKRLITDPKKIGITFSRDEKASIASRKVIRTLDCMFGYFPRSRLYRNSRSYQDGYAAGKYFSALDIELILSNGDEVAAGIIKYYETVSSKLPLVVGQDNTLVAELLNIPTIDFHIEKIGKQAVEKVIAKEKTKHCLEYTLLRI